MHGKTLYCFVETNLLKIRFSPGCFFGPRFTSTLSSFWRCLWRVEKSLVRRTVEGSLKAYTGKVLPHE